jgi:glycosyltransferase involved in cell wall biosynthesis
VIPFGVVVPEVTARPELGSMPEITWIGTGMRRKGGERLLRVFREHLRDRCILNLVTHDEISEEPGVRVISDIQPGDGRLLEILTRTAVLAFPSDMDTFGYAVLEAMAVGVPVVAGRLHAMPEIVADGVTGILIDLDDQQLAAALTRLIDDPSLRARMGDAGRKRVLERFDARVTTSSLVDTLLEARARHASDRERAG